MEIIETPSAEFWEDVVSQGPCATFYHTPLWSKALAETYPELAVSAKGFIFEDGTRAMMPLLCSRHGFFKKKLRYKSLGFGSYGGPAYAGTWDAAKNEALYRYFKSKKASLHVDGNPLWRYDLPDCFSKSDVSTYAIRLDKPEDALWKQFSSGHQRGIKAAKKKGVTVRKASSLRDYEAYCSIYKDTLERWGKKTVIEFPDSLTLKLLEPHHDSVILWLAEIDARPIAGIIIFYCNTMAHYWRGASIKKDMEYHASTFLQWVVMQDALHKGYALYDFAPSGSLEGVDEFKRRFGAEKIFFKKGHLKG
ncbi:MAG: peptidoglycan bridge formation glycyltransferase FemA/FemB family protein [Pseudomonadota bacterium]